MSARVLRPALAFALACATPAGCTERTPEPTGWFVDVTARSGLSFRHENGAGGEKQMPEIFGGGVAVLDYDGDGDLDLFFAQGAPFPGCSPQDRDFRDRLFRNDGDRFTDVTDAVGASDADFTFSAAAGDHDGDGDPDLLLCNFGGVRLLRNDVAERGRFTDVTAESGLRSRGWCQCAAYADFDRDGDLDLYVGHYVVYDAKQSEWCGDRQRGDAYRTYCGPDVFSGEPDELYRNDGNGRFTDVSGEIGVSAPLGKCLGLLIIDADDDGDTDLFVSNDSTPNLLWRNDSLPGGPIRLTEVSMDAGCSVGKNGVARASMGVDAADTNGDGDQEIFVTTFTMEPNTLFRSDGDGFYTDWSLESGLGEPSRLWVGFGSRFLDIDRDGDEDLFVVNGHVTDTIELTSPGIWYRQPSQIFLNRGDGRFTLAGPEAGAYLAERHLGRALASWDSDDDGDLDLVIANNGEPAVMLENRTPARSGWIGFDLRGAPPNGAAIGARVTLRAGGRQQVREVRGTCSYAAWCDLRLLFGVGTAAEVEWAEVRWPRGGRTRLEHLSLGRYVEVRESP